MHVSLVTPDDSFFDGEAEQVTLPAWDGEIGVLPGHAPLIARLGHGVARVFDGTKTHYIAVYGGFLKVQNDRVTVLAGGAARPEDADPAAAKTELDEAERALADAVASTETPQAERREAEERAKRARTFQALVDAAAA